MAQQRISPPASGSNVENLGQEGNNSCRNNPLDLNGGVKTANVDPRRELLEVYRERRKLEKEAISAERKPPFVVGCYPLDWLKNYPL